MNLLVFVYLLLFFALSKKHLDWAILFLIFALPSYLIRFKIFGIPTTVLEAMIWIVFLSWLIFHTEFLKYLRGRHGVQYFRKQKKQRMPYPFGKEIIAFLIISFLSVTVSGFSNSALGAWKAYFFEPILLFVVILNVFQGREKVKKILWALVVSAFFVSVLAIWQKFTGLFIYNDFWAAEETRRSVSFFGYPNAVGLYLGPLVLVFVGWLSNVVVMDKKDKDVIFNFKFFNSCLPAGRFKQFFNVKILKILFIVLVVLLSLAAVYSAKSEGALVGVMAGLIVFGLLSGRTSRLATIAAVIIFTVGIAGYQPTRNYAIQKITLQDLSGQIRLQQWKETWQMLKNGKVITGAGLANYQSQVAPYHQEGIFFNRDNDLNFHKKTVFNEEYRKKYWQPVETYLYPHNIFLNFWSELGLAGLLLFIWIIGKYFLIAYRITRNLPTGQAGAYHEKYLVLGLVGAMVVIIVHGLVDVPYFKNDLAVMFWIFMAIISLINIEKHYEI